MKHIAAYALLLLGGNEFPTAAEVEKVIKEAGAHVDKEKITALVNALDGKPFDELVCGGLETLELMGREPPAGGASASDIAKQEEAHVEDEPDDDVGMVGCFFEDDY